MAAALWLFTLCRRDAGTSARTAGQVQHGGCTLNHDPGRRGQEVGREVDCPQLGSTVICTVISLVASAPIVRGHRREQARVPCMARWLPL